MPMPNDFIVFIDLFPVKIGTLFNYVTHSISIGYIDLLIWICFKMK
jgi:hypothetical protein